MMNDDALPVLGVAGIVVLLGWLYLGRRSAALPRLVTSEPSRVGWILACAVVVAGNAPLLVRLPLLWGSRPFLSGDAYGHALFAHQIATKGLPHGWLEGAEGGFPIGLHYPCVGWFLAALVERLGATPETAVQIVGIAPFLVAPIVVLVAARRAGLGPVAGAIGALFLSWYSPHNSFFGGWEGYLTKGLLSQSIVWCALPFAVMAVAVESRRLEQVLAGALLVLAHPQVAVATLAVLGFGALASGHRPSYGRYAFVAASGVIAGVAQYGRGLTRLAVPFGWPPMESWKHIGYPPSRLMQWAFDGDILDHGRFPVLTLVFVSAIAIVSVAARRPSSRAALMAFAAAIAYAVAGTALPHMGSLGDKLLAFLQPLRVLPTLPYVGVLLTMLAAAELRAWTRGSPRYAAASAASLVLVAVAVPSFRSRWGTLKEYAEVKYAAECEGTHRDLAVSPLAPWILEPGPGRLDFASTYDTVCATTSGKALLSGRPQAFSGGVGGHVGVNMIAFWRLWLTQPGSATRAEALGVRRVLFVDGSGPAADEPHWSELARAGGHRVAERLGGSDIVGVGCVRTLWTGSDAALRRALLDGLDKNADEVLSPRDWIALVPSSDSRPLERVAVQSDGCDFQGAEVHETPREPGAYEAIVVAPHEVDVVIRASYVPEWRVQIDGRNAVIRPVAPGFFSVRVHPGTHRIDAVVSLPRGYVASLVLAAIALTALAFARPAGIFALARALRSKA